MGNNYNEQSKSEGKEGEKNWVGERYWSMVFRRMKVQTLEARSRKNFETGDKLKLVL
jgi:hypothetical protein